MDEYASESDSDYTSYWRDWVSRFCCLHPVYLLSIAPCPSNLLPWGTI